MTRKVAWFEIILGIVMVGFALVLTIMKVLDNQPPISGFLGLILALGIYQIYTGIKKLQNVTQTKNI